MVMIVYDTFNYDLCLNTNSHALSSMIINYHLVKTCTNSTWYLMVMNERWNLRQLLSIIMTVWMGLNSNFLLTWSNLFPFRPFSIYFYPQQLKPLWSMSVNTDSKHCFCLIFSCFCFQLLITRTFINSLEGLSYWDLTVCICFVSPISDTPPPPANGSISPITGAINHKNVCQANE